MGPARLNMTAAVIEHDNGVKIPAKALRVLSLWVTQLLTDILEPLGQGVNGFF